MVHFLSSSVHGHFFSDVRSSYERHSSTCPNLQNKSEPSVVQDQYKWTVYMSAVNLPAVLNDPRLAKRDTAIFSKTWGEAFERTSVKPSHFSYITQEHFKTYTETIVKVKFIIQSIL